MGLGVLVVSGIGLAQLARFTVPFRFRELFERHGQAAGVSPNLLHAIAWHESGLQPGVVSNPNRDGTRDFGLMQVNERNFSVLGLTPQTALDPDVSVRAAARLLADIQRTHPGTADALAIYNAGPARDGGPKLTATGAYINQEYVRAVLVRYQLLQLAALAPVQRTA